MLICVEGCLGVGKSTLVQRVTERIASASFYEEVAVNPFLRDFYRDASHYALHAQYTFLLLQARRYQEALTYVGKDRTVTSAATAHPPLASGSDTLAICDFHPFKSLIFSKVVLREEEREPLSQLYRLLKIPRPDLVVYLRADEHTILARLRKRNDVYRTDIDFAYITQVCCAYDDFFRTYQGPQITIDTTHIDYVRHPQELSILLQQVPLLFPTQKLPGQSEYLGSAGTYRTEKEPRTP
ncbi:MAG: deoxynucleoside kinase [Ktedonobacteraceae bacterium]|nr:deoxynucleoside kinase [Ktedonobacteraceae bacterium]